MLGMYIHTYVLGSMLYVAYFFDALVALALLECSLLTVDVAVFKLSLVVNILVSSSDCLLEFRLAFG